VEREIQVDRRPSHEGIFRTAKTCGLIGDIAHFTTEEEFSAKLEIDSFKAMGNGFLSRSWCSQKKE
jgi:hypothetical protein